MVYSPPGFWDVVAGSLLNTVLLLGLAGFAGALTVMWIFACLFGANILRVTGQFVCGMVGVAAGLGLVYVGGLMNQVETTVIPEYAAVGVKLSAGDVMTAITFPDSQVVNGGGVLEPGATVISYDKGLRMLEVFKFQNNRLMSVSVLKPDS